MFTNKSLGLLAFAIGVSTLLGCSKSPEINCSVQKYAELSDPKQKEEMLKACPDLSATLLRSGDYKPSSGKSY